MKEYPEAQSPIILNCHRLMEAFAKSNDERDFYLDKVEGFIIYADLDKNDEEIQELEKELHNHLHRYCTIPKFTFYETKKIMEGFVHEKVYDIDTKEKLIEIIQSKEARENFLEFIYDQHSEFEKWQQYYQERSRIRIIEWLRQHNIQFVFEEDLDFTKNLLEKIKQNLFESKVGKEIVAARKTLVSKAKTYYSSEALNPRPKRGRPPKQAAKLEIEPQYTVDIYTNVPPPIRPFLFTPDINASTAWTFSSKFDTEESFLSGRQQFGKDEKDSSVQSLNNKLAALRNLSSQWVKEEKPAKKKEETSYLEHEKAILQEFEQGKDIQNTIADKESYEHKGSKTCAKKTSSPKTIKSKKEETVSKESKPEVKRIIKQKDAKKPLKPAPKKVAKPVKRRLKKTR